MNHRYNRLPLVVAVVGALAMAPAMVQAHDAASQPAVDLSNVPVAVVPVSVPVYVAAPQQTTTTDQTTNQTTKKKKAQRRKVQRMQAVQVTGTLIDSLPENETSMPVEHISVEQGIKAGKISTADILASSAIASSGSQNIGQFSGFLVNGGIGTRTISLFGLGAHRTLVLIDGHRAGPSGTGPNTEAFNFNVIPSVIVKNFDVVQDGASSVYGSDAVAGVINVITKVNIDHPTFDVGTSVPLKSGGEQYKFSFSDGWNFSNGNIVFALQAIRHNPLEAGDRSYLNCARPLTTNVKTGKLDRLPDHSVLQGTPYQGCGGLLVDTAINAQTGARFVPTKDGHTGPDSLIPGFENANFANMGFGPGQQPFNLQPDYGAYLNRTYIVPRRSNYSGYFASDFQLGNIGWTTQLLFNESKNQTQGFAQFFPGALYPYGSNLSNFKGVFEPIMPYEAFEHTHVDYVWASSTLSGFVPGTETWDWQVNLNFSNSRGVDSALAPPAVLSGDVLGVGTTAFGDPGSVVQSTVPWINPFDHGFLDGSKMGLLESRFVWGVQTTLARESNIKAKTSGTLFNWYAGAVRAAFGVHYRHDKFNNTPGPNIINHLQWGRSSSGITQGTDNNHGIFGELNVPVLHDLPGAKRVNIDMSGRRFEYTDVGKHGHVWTLGLNWQIIPSLRVRGNIGTSYVAPTLPQLFLADQTGFFSQLADPCINWGKSSTPNIRKNCAAAGIPSDYAGVGQTGEEHASGGAGSLVPERSRSKVFGFVWTPSFFGNFSLSAEYYNFHVTGEIRQLGAGNILEGCYNNPNPNGIGGNAFCQLFTRAGPNGGNGFNPFNVESVNNDYINVSGEKVKGYLLWGSWGNQYAFGHVAASGQVNYTKANVTNLFGTAALEGLATTNFEGLPGSPQFTGEFHVNWSRGPWSAQWQAQYIGATRDWEDPAVTTIAGNGPLVHFANRLHAEVIQSISVQYTQKKFSVLLGMSNFTDQKPPLVSPGDITTIGNGLSNTSISASQYDLFGRSLFMNFKYTL